MAAGWAAGAMGEWRPVTGSVTHQRSPQAGRSGATVAHDALSRLCRVAAGRAHAAGLCWPQTAGCTARRAAAVSCCASDRCHLGGAACAGGCGAAGGSRLHAGAAGCQQWQCHAACAPPHQHLDATGMSRSTGGAAGGGGQIRASGAGCGSAARCRCTCRARRVSGVLLECWYCCSRHCARTEADPILV
jgi:hypothetical protein